MLQGRSQGQARYVGEVYLPKKSSDISRQIVNYRNAVQAPPQHHLDKSFARTYGSLSRVEDDVRWSMRHRGDPLPTLKK